MRYIETQVKSNLHDQRHSNFTCHFGFTMAAAPGTPTSPASPAQDAPVMKAASQAKAAYSDFRERVKEGEKVVRSETPSPVTDDEDFKEWTPELFESGISVAWMKRSRFATKAES